MEKSTRRHCAPMVNEKRQKEGKFWSTMKRTEIVRKFIVDELLFGEDAALRDETLLFDQSILDSMGFMELINFLQKEFGVEISDDELTQENFKSLDSIGKLLERKLETDKHKRRE